MKIKLIVLSLLLSPIVFSKGILLTCEDSVLGKYYINNEYFTLKKHPKCGLEKPTMYVDIKFDTEEEYAVLEYFSCNTQGLTSYWDYSYNGTVKKLPDEYVFIHKNPGGYTWQQNVSRKNLIISGSKVDGLCELEEITEKENIF